MNIFAIIILSALLIDYLVQLTADLLNLKTLNQPLPAEFEGVVDEETYQRSQAYTLERTRFGLVTGTIGLAALLLFWFLGGFQWLDELVRSASLGDISTGLLYIGALMLLKTLLSLPFSIYSTFVIEEKYGFNKTTAGTFISDLFKGLLLAVLLGGPLLAAVIAFFVYGGEFAWLWAWIAITLFSLGVQFIAPTWIMPLFNKFEPLEDGELKDEILQAADKADFPLKGVYVMDGSKRSDKSNAFFTGFGNNKRIALFDTLIEKHSNRELVAVLAHEIGHYKKGHIPRNMAISILQTGIMLAILSLFLQVPGLYDAFFVEQMSVYTGLVFFGLLYSPVDMILSIFMQMLSRKYEFEADAFAVETMEGAEPLAEALKKLSRDNLSHLTPHPFYVFLNYSHPPVPERIRAMKAFENSLTRQESSGTTEPDSTG